MGWLIGIVLGVALVLAVRGLFVRPGAGSPYPPRRQPDRMDRLDRKAAQYRSSGALPPWD